MTRTVWFLAVPCFAFVSHPVSSGEMRENRPFPAGVFTRCPNAIPVANTTVSTALTRLPQAALCRSPRSEGLRLCVVTIEISPFLHETGGKIVPCTGMSCCTGGATWPKVSGLLAMTCKVVLAMTWASLSRHEGRGTNCPTRRGQFEGVSRAKNVTVHENEVKSNAKGGLSLAACSFA